MRKHTIHGMPTELMELIVNSINTIKSGLILVASDQEDCCHQVMSYINSYHVYLNEFNRDNATYCEAAHDKNVMPLIKDHNSIFMNDANDIKSLMSDIAIYNHVSKPIIFLYENAHKYDIEVIENVVEKGFFVVCSVEATTISDALLTLYPSDKLACLRRTEIMRNLSKSLVGIMAHRTVPLGQRLSDVYDTKFKSSDDDTAIFEVVDVSALGFFASFKAKTRTFRDIIL